MPGHFVLRGYLTTAFKTLFPGGRPSITSCSHHNTKVKAYTALSAVSRQTSHFRSSYARYTSASLRCKSRVRLSRARGTSPIDRQRSRRGRRDQRRMGGGDHRVSTSIILKLCSLMTDGRHAGRSARPKHREAAGGKRATYRRRSTGKNGRCSRRQSLETQMETLSSLAHLWDSGRGPEFSNSYGRTWSLPTWTVEHDHRLSNWTNHHRQPHHDVYRRHLRLSSKE